MTVTDPRSIDPNDLSAIGVRWDLAPLLAEFAGVEEMLDAADAIAEELVSNGRGRIAEMGAANLAAFFRRYAALLDLAGRAGSYAGLVFAADTSQPEHGALMARVQERSTAISTKLLFIDLEWAAASDEHVDAVLSDPDPALDFVRHHLRSERRYRDHVLTEPEERVLTEKSITGASAWGRLFDELCSAMEVEIR